MSDYTKIIKAFAVAGVLWATLATAAGFLNELQIFLHVPGSDTDLAYGLLRPFRNIALIFGAGLSLFLAGVLHAVRGSNNVKARFPLAGAAAFLCLQTAVLFGAITVLSSANKGREYGEMTFLSDLLVEIALALMLVVVLFSPRDGRRPSASSVFVAATLAGSLVAYLAGNLSLPYGPLHSTPPTAGARDAAVQEFYRSCILGFFLLMPLFATLLHFVPEHYRVPLYSRKTADFQALAMAALIPLSGASALAGSPGSPVIGVAGAVASMALAVAIAGGAFNVRNSVVKSPDPPHSDSIAMFLRCGLCLLLLCAVLRAIALQEIVRSRLGLTWFNTEDISLDAQTYGLLIFFGAIYILAERITGRRVSRFAAGAQLVLCLAGSALMLTSNVVQGILESAALQAPASPGAAAPGDWANVIFAGSFAPTPAGRPADVSMQYLLGFRGLYFIGSFCMLVGIALGSGIALFALLKSGHAIDEPRVHAPNDSNATDETADQAVAPSAISRGRTSPVAFALATALLVVAGYGLRTGLSFDAALPHASGPFLEPPPPPVLAGHEVYLQNGCQYCHTQNLRPLEWEVRRFVVEKNYGRFPLPDAMEHYYLAPFPRGSARIGPDLSRVAGKYEKSELEALLRGGGGRPLLAAHHRFSHLFHSSERFGPGDGVLLSWKIRALMNAGIPFSAEYQKSVFERIVGKTRGEALVEYLDSLGRRQMEFAGRYYRN